MKRYAQLSLTLVCFVFGVILALQVKTIYRQNAVSSLGAQRANELTSELRQVTDEKKELEAQLAEYKDKVLQYEKLAAGREEIDPLLAELEKTRMLGGLTELTGRGVEVTLTDSAKKLDVDPKVLLIHDEDLLSVINELNAAGSEAIAINDQRLVSTTAVRCVGPVINVNGVKVASPFVIKAIGDPEVLESALKMTGGVVDNLAPWGIGVAIKKSPQVTIPRWEGSFRFSEAKNNEAPAAGQEVKP